MIEVPSSSFFEHRNYTATYYALYIALEQWISKVAFREDISRVFLSSDKYAFRRRFELTDTTTAYTETSVSSLRFPFANYWPSNTGWSPDERPAANTAAMVLRGITEGSRYLRAMAVTKRIPFTFYFNREDDARLCYERLLYTAYKEQFITTNVAWRQQTLDIPLYIKVQDLAFNPNRDEQTWLEEHRIFTLTAVMELRSFVLHPLPQPHYADQNLPEDDEFFYLTEEVIMGYIGGKDKELSVSAHLDPNIEILINQFGIASSTITTARLTWDIQAPNLTSIKLRLSGREFISIDPTRTDYTFRALKQHSTYRVLAIFEDESGVTKEAFVTFTTPISQEEAEQLEAPHDSLVGTTW